MSSCVSAIRILDSALLNFLKTILEKIILIFSCKMLKKYNFNNSYSSKMAGKRKCVGLGSIYLDKIKFFNLWHHFVSIKVSSLSTGIAWTTSPSQKIVDKCSVVALEMSMMGINAPIPIFWASHSRSQKSFVSELWGWISYFCRRKITDGYNGTGGSSHSWSWKNNNQIICQSVANSNISINNNLGQIFDCLWGDMLDSAELQASGLEVTYYDLLPDDLVNVGLMHHVAKAVGNWMDSIVCQWMSWF